MKRKRRTRLLSLFLGLSLALSPAAREIGRASCRERV